MTKITGPVLDSAGQPATFHLVGRQVRRYTSPGGFVTDHVVKALVKGGEPTFSNGDPLEVPATPLGCAIRWTETHADGRAVIRLTAIPDVDEIAYGDLEDIDPDTIADKELVDALAQVQGDLAERPTRAEANAAYAPLVAGTFRNVAVVLGDSNTANPRGADVSDAAGVGMAPGWFQMLCMLSKGRIVHGGTFARASYTTQQVADAKLASVLALDPAPGACFINLGSNDLSQDSGGGAGTGFDLAASTAAYVSILDALRARGILPIIVIPTPHKVAYTLVQFNQVVWQKRLRELGERYNCPVVDFYTPVLDSTTGGIASAYQLDGPDALHVNAVGRRVLAQSALAQIAHVFPPALNLTSKSMIDPTNLVPSGTGLNGGASGWITTGPGAAGLTPSAVDPTADDALAGKWHRMVSTSATDAYRQRTTVTPSGGMGATGDIIQVTCRAKISGLEAAIAAGQAGDAYLRVALRNSSSVLQYLYANRPSPAFDADVPDAVFRGRLALPAGCDRFTVEAHIVGASIDKPITFQFGELTVRNLTALGTLT